MLHRPATPSPAVLACYNAVPNVLWSVVSLTPLTVFCYQHVPRPWLYWFVGVSLLAYVWPTAWLRYVQLSKTTTLYRTLGVPALNHFTQHGILLNRLLRHRYPQFRHQFTRANRAKLVRATYQQERFHWGMLAFFVFITGYAVGYRHMGWAALLTFLNVGYNLYPVWLQQYLRLRLLLLDEGRRMSIATPTPPAPYTPTAGTTPLDQS